MAATRLLLCILCFAFSGSIGMFNGNLLIGTDRKRGHRQIMISPAEMAVRERIIALAENEIGVREETNHNDGLRVENYLAAVNLKKGDPWCAAYVSYIFKEAGFAKPRTGWSPDMFPSSRLARSALPANLLGIYFPEYGRIAHVGRVVRQDGDWLISCEGNTDVEGSREGQGVYLRRRHIRTIYQFADWVNERRARK